MKPEPEQTTIFDICARKHGGNAESVAANPSATAKASMRAELLNKPLNAISGRISELKRAGLVTTTGARREGAAVLKVKR